MRLLLFLLPFVVLSANSKAQDKDAVWTLQELINYALKNSKSLIQSRMDVEISKLNEDVATQNRKYGFTLNVQNFSGLSIGKTKGIVSGGVVVSGGTKFISFVTSQFNYPLFSAERFIFQRSIAEDISHITYEQSGKTYLLAKQGAIYSVANLFSQIIFKKKELEYRNRNVARLKPIVEQSRERLKKKLITEADFLQTQLLLTNEQTNIKLAELDLDILKKQLANAIGMPLTQEPPEIEDDVSIFENMSSLIPDLDTLLSWTLEQNPNLPIAALTVKSSELNLKLTQSSVYPTMSFTASSSLTSSLHNADLIGMTITFPLHELFKRFLTKDPAVLAAKLTIEKNKVNLQAVRDSVKLGLMQAYTNWEKARETSISGWNNVKVQETIVNQSENRLKSGLITIGDYLTVLNSYEDAYNQFEQDKSTEYNDLLLLLQNAGVIDRFLTPQN